MTPFLTEDFLLQTETARRLYHEVAKVQPIIDYHCHLPPDQVAGNHKVSRSRRNLAGRGSLQVARDEDQRGRRAVLYR